MQPLDGLGELFEGHANPGLNGFIGGDFVVTAPQVLNEGMTGRHRSGGAESLESAHRPKTYP